ncbi:AAA family ATPase [Pseudobutyrivibrio xylanivorans]|uniref:AAA family ATPase n=1 Tax=Pseudobutyrivibrio xylanivorans TaxID=185007 RepID=UPI001FA95D2A|nr:AAA family ATPase [Pseudobutyrivibrio xylanivorans]
MGIYLNPGNEGFKNIINGIYRDKTGLIDVVNSTINTPDKLTCISRPRRFGKSYAAKMLSAYYDKSCSDSKELFSKSDYEISKKIRLKSI